MNITNDAVIKVARDVGLSPSAMVKLSEALNAAGGKVVLEIAASGETMLPHAEAIGRSLRTADSLSPAQRADVLKILARDGHITGYDPENRALYASAAKPDYLVSPAVCAAASPNNVALLNQVKNQLRRHGYDLDLTSTDRLSQHDIDAALRSSTASTVEKMQVKTSLAQLGLIA